MDFMLERSTENKELKVNFIRPVNRIKSKGKALTKKLIYVYCPSEKELEIGKIVADYSFDIVINDYSIDSYDEKVICHFESSSLSIETQIGKHPWIF